MMNKKKIREREGGGGSEKEKRKPRGTKKGKKISPPHVSNLLLGCEKRRAYCNGLVDRVRERSGTAC